MYHSLLRTIALLALAVWVLSPVIHAEQSAASEMNLGVSDVRVRVLGQSGKIQFWDDSQTTGTKKMFMVEMNRLYEHGDFCSPTYRDMPFILAPGIWQKICKISHRDSELQERAHGDGVEIGFDSPEAFEEIFWPFDCGWQSYCNAPTTTDRRLCNPESGLRKHGKSDHPETGRL